MTLPTLVVKKELLQACLGWFQEDFQQSIGNLLEAEFPNYALPSEVLSVRGWCEKIRQLLEEKSAGVDIADFFMKELAAGPGSLLFKQILLRSRRRWAARTEGYRERTFHPEIIQAVEEAINSLTLWSKQTGSRRSSH